MTRPAIFLDRDGTVIEDAGYLADPAGVQLFDDTAEAIRELSKKGYLVVLTSNQSGVARGKFTEAQLAQVHARMEQLLSADGARLDAAYYCPFLDGPDATVDRYRKKSDLRKPQPGMLLQAAKELRIDLARSWMIGDSAADVGAGQAAGCRTILVRRNGTLPADDVRPTHRAATLEEAVRIIESHPPPDAAPDADDRIVAVLERIHDQLDRAQRRQRQNDFSFLRLFGALLQMLAIVVALWGSAALFDDAAPAAARLLLACFLQLAALTSFALDRIR
jgi:D-glycero-D-manno-heptose 1,7-bisphosphate phosphatase